MLFNLLFFLLFCANIGLSWVLGSWIGVGLNVGILLVGIFVTLGMSIFFGGIGMIFGKHSEKTQFRKFLQYLLASWKWLILGLLCLPWMLLGIVWFLNTFSPAVLPKIVITNGDKTVVFQSMIHIGSQRFYQAIADDMMTLRDKEYVFFYEGVQSGSEESLKELSQLMGMDVSEKMYHTFAQLGGLVPQDVEMFTKILPSTNIDLTTDEIVQLAREAQITPPKKISQMEYLEKFDLEYDTLNVFQKKVLMSCIHAMLNVLLMNYTHPNLEKELQEVMPLFEIILHKRSDLLIQAISDTPSKNIYIHYGALHYAGIMKGLQALDPRWREISRTDFGAL